MSEILLPPNATPQELALEGATSRVVAVPSPVRDVWDADAAPDALLPWLAWAYSVDEWDAGWSPAQRREAIRRSVEVHRYKGTIGAVRTALAALGFDVVIQEWFNQSPVADPYTFTISLTTSQTGVNAAAIARILSVVNSTKNLRSHLTKIRPTVVSRSEVYTAGAPGIGTDVTVKPEYTDPDALMDAFRAGFFETPSTSNSMRVMIHEKLPEISFSWAATEVERLVNEKISKPNFW